MCLQIPDYPIVVTTCDKYLPILKPFAWLLTKYWQPLPKVTIVGCAKPEFDLPPNFSFYSVGKQEDYTFNRWSNMLHDYLVTIQDDVFALLLDDYFVCRQVDTEAVEIAVAYTRQLGYVMKFDICADRLYSMGADLDYGVCGRLDLVKSMPGAPYFFSWWPGIWRRDNLLDFMIPNESPHDMELQGTTRMAHLGNKYLVVGSRQYPLRICLGIRSQVMEVDLSGLGKPDRDEMMDLGLFAGWKIKDS